MATRAEYRQELRDKLVGLEDSGYGDFDWSDTELNTYLSLSVARLFPALYKRVTEGPYAVTPYGHDGYGYLDHQFADRVFLIDDAFEYDAVLGWGIRPGRIVGLPTNTQYVIYYYEAYALPADDVTDTGISATFVPLLVLGALIEALEARHDSGVRPDQQTGYPQTSMLDRLYARYGQLRQDIGMSLPAMVA